jgi:hypothetical protein
LTAGFCSVKLWRQDPKELLSSLGSPTLQNKLITGLFVDDFSGRGYKATQGAMKVSVSSATT